jgi:ParB-like chromosome segregation protein Spo0J
MRRAQRLVADLVPHPLSDVIFGQMTAEEIHALQEDVRVRGLQDELHIDLKDRVICGSQRLRAIEGLGWVTVDVKVQEHLLTEADIDEHLLLHNVQRRNMTPSVRYRVGIELERIESIRAQTRQQTGQEAATTARTDDKTAKRLDMSSSTWRRLKAVHEHGGEGLKQAVDRREVSIAAAAQSVQTPRSKAGTLTRNDKRAQSLRMARLKRDGNALLKYMRMHELADYGGHGDEAIAYLRGISRAIGDWTRR